MIDETYKFDPNDINATKPLAWLSYLWVLFLVPMLVNQNSPFTKFHVNQGIIFLILSIIANIVCIVANFIPFFGGLVAGLIRLALLALMIVGIINAAQGKAKRLPIIGNMELYK
ncbi:MAG: DUF4870 domain-containing protein [Oscillospiraceae bacterium]